MTLITSHQKKRIPSHLFNIFNLGAYADPVGAPEFWLTPQETRHSASTVTKITAHAIASLKTYR